MASMVCFGRSRRISGAKTLPKPLVAMSIECVSVVPTPSDAATPRYAMRFTVRDDGSGFDVPQSHRRGDPQIGGWGLYLVDAIADRWGVEHEPTMVWLEVARH